MDCEKGIHSLCAILETKKDGKTITFCNEEFWEGQCKVRDWDSISRKVTYGDKKKWKKSPSLMLLERTEMESDSSWKEHFQKMCEIEAFLHKAEQAENDFVKTFVAAANVGHHRFLQRMMNTYDRSKIDKVSRGSYTSTAVIEAAKFGNTKCLVELIKWKANLNETTHTNNDNLHQLFTYRTPLMWAAFGGHDQCVLALIEGGAKLNTIDYGGHTALMFATTKDSEKCVVALIEGGAGLNRQDNNGTTALMWAAIQGSVRSVAELVEGKAKLNVRDKTGMTALAWAENVECEECVKVLIEANAGSGDEDEQGSDESISDDEEEFPPDPTAYSPTSPVYIPTSPTSPSW
jgi:hypothetical protein